MSWQFLYITKEKVERELKRYPEDGDYNEFISVSDDLKEACGEFNRFAENLELWDVDIHAKQQGTCIYECINEFINYKDF